MLALDLPEIYGVETRALNQAVKRNPARFPSRFMFQLTAEEAANLKSQSVISSWGGARRALPFAFTEHGAVMLAAVLNSERAVHSNELQKCQVGMEASGEMNLEPRMTLMGADIEEAQVGGLGFGVE